MILFYAWLSTLLLGAAHHSLDPRVPALGYWTVVFVALAVRFATTSHIAQQLQTITKKGTK